MNSAPSEAANTPSCYARSRMPAKPIGEGFLMDVSRSARKHCGRGFGLAGRKIETVRGGRRPLPDGKTPECPAKMASADIEKSFD